jgi:ABC-type lipoprotein release transport system permease subunit
MTKTALKVVLFATCLCLLLALSPPSTIAQSSSERIIAGQVKDNVTDQPIVNATISVWNTAFASPIHWRLVTTAKTDDDGTFILKVRDDTSYRIYVFYNNSLSPGFDYAPVFHDLPLSKTNVSLSIRLIPAASLLFEGSLWFVESTKASESFSFTITAENATTSSDCEYVYSYGSVPPNHNFLNTSITHVILPLEASTQIDVNASILSEDKIIEKYFIIRDLEAFNLSQGVLTRVNIEKYTTLLNYDVVAEQVNATAHVLREIDEESFYLVAEKEDLAYTTSLLELAGTKISTNQYGKAYTDLRESYVTNTVLAQRLESLQTNAVGSVFGLTFFLAITSITLSFLLFEKRATKFTTYPVFFTSFFAALYAVHPGCRLTPIHLLIEYVVVSLGSVAFLVLVLPKILREKTASTFSLSKRNLRRRSRRFTLTTATIIILVMSFVSLTSFSTGYGFTTSKSALSPSPLLGGLFLQEPQPPSSPNMYNYVPLTALSIELVAEKPGILHVAAKAENQPRLNPLGYLYTPSTSQPTPFYGFLGIQPSTEAEMTGLNSLVVEGRYLREDDENAILISNNLAETMDLEVNSTVTLHYGTSVEVLIVGFFDADRFRLTEDLNGKDFAPSKLTLIDPEYPPIKETCEPNEVIITTLNDATNQYYLPLSRIDILIENSGETASFAKELALEQGLSVWYTDDNSLYEAVVTSFFEEKGAIIFIPWIIVLLNVLMTMLNSIFEYRKEISTLSAIGLNPSDIMGLFIAEAAVIGVLGGGIGYILGIGSYKVMSALSIIVEVRPKVSAVWSFASLFVSISAVLVGALVALKSSVDITPSTLRRWRLGSAPQMGDPWVFDVPFRVREEELPSLFEYVAARFRRHLAVRSIDEKSGKIQFLEEDHPEGSTRVLDFHYLLGNKSNVGSLPFRLVAKKEAAEDAYSFDVVCKGTEETVRETVSFIRMSIIEWSSNQDRN